MERPNTVAGLVAKRAELAKFRKGLEAELRKVTCDLDHLDASIALFDVSLTPKAVQRYVTKHRAKKGSVTPFVIQFLREAPGPVTSRDITEAWNAARGLRTDDATFVIIRKRIGACLAKLRNQGHVSSVVMDGVYKAWKLVRFAERNVDF